MAGVDYVNIFDQEPDMGVRQSFGGLSGAANRSAAPGVIGRRPARGFWRFPSAGDSNPGGVFHQDLRRRRWAGTVPGFLLLRSPARHSGHLGAPGRWPSAAADLRPEPSGDPGPLLRPAVAAYHVPQAQHRIHVGPRPVHPPSLQPRFHHQLVGALNDPAPDGIVLAFYPTGCSMPRRRPLT